MKLLFLIVVSFWRLAIVMKLPFLQCKLLEACKPHEIAILGLQAFGELQPS
jgi:hypothetical protein